MPAEQRHPSGPRLERRLRRAAAGGDLDEVGGQPREQRADQQPGDQAGAADQRRPQPQLGAQVAGATPGP